MAVVASGDGNGCHFSARHLGPYSASTAYNRKGIGKDEQRECLWRKFLV